MTTLLNFFFIPNLLKHNLHNVYHLRFQEKVGLIGSL